MSRSSSIRATEVRCSNDERKHVTWIDVSSLSSLRTSIQMCHSKVEPCATEHRIHSHTQTLHGSNDSVLLWPNMAGRIWFDPCFRYDHRGKSHSPFHTVVVLFVVEEAVSRASAQAYPLGKRGELRGGRGRDGTGEVAGGAIRGMCTTILLAIPPRNHRGVVDSVGSGRSPRRVPATTSHASSPRQSFIASTNCRCIYGLYQHAWKLHARTSHLVTGVVA